MQVSVSPVFYLYSEQMSVFDTCILSVIHDCVHTHEFGEQLASSSLLFSSSSTCAVGTSSLSYNDERLYVCCVYPRPKRSVIVLFLREKEITPRGANYVMHVLVGKRGKSTLNKTGFRVSGKAESPLII